MTRPSRISRGVILGQLRLAAKKGDRAALTLAVDQMKTLGVLAPVLAEVHRSCSRIRSRASWT